MITVCIQQWDKTEWKECVRLYAFVSPWGEKLSSFSVQTFSLCLILPTVASFRMFFFFKFLLSFFCSLSMRANFTWVSNFFEEKIGLLWLESITQLCVHILVETCRIPLNTLWGFLTVHAMKYFMGLFVLITLNCCCFCYLFATQCFVNWKK